jgi:hypothetical protein
MPNECEVPGTDFIADRTKANLCEEFRLKVTNEAILKPSPQDIEKLLFGDSEVKDKDQSPKDRFNSLFKDD